MKRLTIAILSTILTISMSLVSCNNGNKQDISNEENKKDVTQIEGNVSFAVPASQVETTEKIFDKFNEIYPKIEVELVPYEGNVTNFITAQAATGDLPDIIDGTEDILYPLSQGIIYPLNEFVEDDPDYKYVSQELMKDFTINKVIASLPHKMTVSGIMVNLGLLEQLNMDIPSYEWTINEFLDYTKKSTTDKYSGLANLGRMQDLMMGVFGEGATNSYGYNPETQKFEFSKGSWVNTFSFINKLTSVPGLVASTLTNKTLRDEGKEDDYQKKFGKEGNGLNDGKILGGSYGLWDLGSGNFKFNYDFYPYPHDREIGFKFPIHVDHAYMTNYAENKEATFQVLKWYTYSREGTIAKFKIRGEMENPSPRFILPATNDPEVAKVFNSLDMPEGLKYMYTNIDKGFSGYNAKFVPGFKQIMNEILGPMATKVINGEVDAASIVEEMENKANEITQNAREQLNKDMAQFDYYNIK